MIDTQVFNMNPDTGVVTLMHYDEADGTVVFETQQDVEPLLDLQAQRRVDKSDYRRWAGDWHHIAHVPTQILMRMRLKCMEWQADGSKRLNQARWNKMVTDWINENSQFRSVPWRI